MAPEVPLWGLDWEMPLLCPGNGHAWSQSPGQCPESVVFDRSPSLDSAVHGS